MSIITKNALLLRDLDLLIELQKDNLIAVALSITTLNEDLRRTLEPRTSSAANKLKAMKVLSEHNIPVFGMIAPIIPSLNNHEVFNLAEQLKLHGAIGFSSIIVRLNDAVEPIFKEWIYKTFPDRAEKVLNQIKETHGGNLGSKTPIERMKGTGRISENINQTLKLASQKFFPDFEYPKLNMKAFIPLLKPQLELFGE